MEREIDKIGNVRISAIDQYPALDLQIYKSATTGLPEEATMEFLLLMMDHPIHDGCCCQKVVSFADDGGPTSIE